jgi:DNA invertase Pin-like site-specific DNA recombinase
MNENSAPFRRIGYARVSTVGQTLEAQLDQLKAAGCSSIFRETASGAKADRKLLRRLIEQLEEGDQVVVTRIDRLARSTFDLFAIVKKIVDAKAQFCSLAEPWADTGTSTGRLMIAVLGGLADVERDLIRTRTSEGRSRAKARGKSLGRPFKLTREQRQEALERRANGEALVDIARSYNVSHTTIGRLRP